jgi:hypothetical protein
MEFEKKPYKVAELVAAWDNGSMVRNPEYQRGAACTLAQKQAFIDSLFRRYQRRHYSEYSRVRLHFSWRQPPSSIFTNKTPLLKPTRIARNHTANRICDRAGRL